MKILQRKKHQTSDSYAASPAAISAAILAEKTAKQGETVWEYCGKMILKTVWAGPKQQTVHWRTENPLSSDGNFTSTSRQSSS
jgi:hypothetical protein